MFILDLMKSKSKNIKKHKKTNENEKELLELPSIIRDIELGDLVELTLNGDEGYLITYRGEKSFDFAYLEDERLDGLVGYVVLIDFSGIDFRVGIDPTFKAFLKGGVPRYEPYMIIETNRIEKYNIIKSYFDKKKSTR